MKKHAILNKAVKFYVRCAPGHTTTSYLEIKSILETINDGCQAVVSKEREINNSSLKNGLFIETSNIKHGAEIAMKSLTIQDIEMVLMDEECKTKTRVNRLLSKLKFKDLFDPHVTESANTFNSVVKLQTRANKSCINSSRFLKEEFFKIASCNLSYDSIDSPNKGQNISTSYFFRIHLVENRLTVTLSLVGENALYKRAYKGMNGNATAPLSEHHASACVLWTIDNFNKKYLPVTKNIILSDIIVPFAGTGTLGFECLLALLSSGGSGLFKDRVFAFDNIPIFSSIGSGKEMLSSDIRAQMRAQIVHNLQQRETTNSYLNPRIVPETRILFSDVNENALLDCKENILSFLESSGHIFPEKIFPDPKCFNFFEESIDNLLQPNSRKEAISQELRTVLILLNPPYGSRLAKKSSSVLLYKRVAHQLTNLRERLKNRVVPSDTPILLGMCLCPDEKSWSTFLNTLSTQGFKHDTMHFSQGGKDIRAVCFCAFNDDVSNSKKQQ